MCSIKRRTNCQKQLVWFLIVPEGKVTHFHVLFQSELFLQEYNSLTQKTEHGGRMIIFVELPTVHDSVVFSISLNRNGQPVADRSGATIFKRHVLSHWAAVGNATAVVTACTYTIREPCSGCSTLFQLLSTRKTHLVSTGPGSICFGYFLRPYSERQNTFLKYVTIVCLSFLIHDLLHPSISCFTIPNVRIRIAPLVEVKNSILKLRPLICLEERGFVNDTFLINKQFGWIGTRVWRNFKLLYPSDLLDDFHVQPATYSHCG